MTEEATLEKVLQALLEDRAKREEELAAERVKRNEEFEKREKDIAAEREKRDKELAAERERRDREIKEEKDRRDREIAEERARHEEEMTLLRDLVKNARRSEPEGKASVKPGLDIKLTKLTAGDDIESFFTVFERIMTAQEIPEERWSFMIAPQLTGRAQQAYAALSTDDARVYKTVKEAVLSRYDINHETYRQRFRRAKLQQGETPRGLATRLKDLARNWLKDAKSMEEVLEAVVLEQFLQTLPLEMRVWLKDRKPATSGEAGQLAEEYIQARGGPQSDILENRRPRCFACGEIGHLAKECKKAQNDRNEKKKAKEEDKNSGGNEKDSVGKGEAGDSRRCFNCKKKGHIAANCPNNTACCMIPRSPQKWRPKGQYVQGRVEGTDVQDILLDTGCSRTVVHRNLVPEAMLQEPNNVTTITCAHGDTVLYPLVDIQLEVDGKSIHVEAAVSPSLPVSVLLGTDVQELSQLLNREDALMMVTRARATQQRHKEEEEKMLSRAEPHQLWFDRDGENDTESTEDDAREDEVEKEEVGEEEIGDEDEVGEDMVEEVMQASEDEPAWPEASEELFLPHRNQKKQKTRSEKRKQRYKHSTRKSTQDQLEWTAKEMQSLQEEDPTLEQPRQIALGEQTQVHAGDNYLIREGLLYRSWTPHSKGKTGDTIEQLVLPEQCRHAVLRLAHYIPMSGHLGSEKTVQRILKRFYWPSVYRDVKAFCKECEQCQKCSKRKPQKVPLIPLPVMGEPFARMAMDIVGPLPKSRGGHRYILVVSDYATRFPEAVPLKTVDADVIAEELIKIFSRFGIPGEILTDQGTNFTSQLLKELYRLLHIEAIRTSPYHPQTDGVVERFNQTLKSMLRKFVSKEGRDWDKLLPYLLFAYREVPQASTGFSPFELLYGRDVRGPLDVVKEAWEAHSRSSESVVSHTLMVRDKLEKMMEVVESNLKEAGTRNKKWYDKHARERTLEKGDQVLILLPTSNNKLLAQWEGPYTVVDRVGSVNYRVHMHDKKKKMRTFHINMLKKWTPPSAGAFFCGEQEDEDLPDYKGEETQQYTTGAKLSEQQKRQLLFLLRDYSDVLQSKPGKTQLTEHKIEVQDPSHAVRLPPYRLPYAYREQAREEVENMLRDGIIRPSSSDWASPMVIVKKTDGSIRICVDYRKINSRSKSDAYPMPRIDELIDQLGKATYLTTLDLTRGYWQVPLAAESREMSAFTTPFGLFEYTVMPFGLAGAPATFQRLMDKVIRGMESYSAAYIDDLIIFSNSWEEHLQHVEQVLTRLRESGLTLKPSKCQFAMSEVRYLGHIVGSGKVRPVFQKVDAIKEFPQPVKKKDVRVFLGLAGYYRRFIPNFASIAAPLTDLMKKSAPDRVKWSASCNKAFMTLKDALCNDPVLQSPDFNCPFILQTDASTRGIGAVLAQINEKGEEHPVAYYSRKLLPREERYATIEQECLAIKLGIQAFKPYLLGRPFQIQTDHRSLEWLNTFKEDNSRLTRWSLFLQPYQFSVQHRAGHLNNNADALSRGHVASETAQMPEKEGGM